MPKTQRQEINYLLQGSNFLQQIFNSIQDGLLIVDEQETIIYANISAEKVLGVPHEILLKSRPEELPLTMYFREGEEIPRGSSPFAVALKQGGHLEPYEVILKRPDGSTLPVLFNIHTKEEGPMVVILTDSSDFMRRQQQSEDYYRLLAHDMRTPLTVILGHAHILQGNPCNTKTMSQSIEAVRDAGEQLVEMTAEMSDRIHLESGHFKPKKEIIQLESLIMGVIAQLTLKETKHHINVQVQTLPAVIADANRLKRVFINLITNAIKYSPEDSTITVSAWENTRGIMATVSDQGQGITAEDLNYLFHPFFITSIGEEKGGIGLGLYISRLIMEAHGGRIYVSSTPGEGSSFAIFLPKT